MDPLTLRITITLLLMFLVTLTTRVLPLYFAKTIEKNSLMQLLSRYLPLLVLTLLTTHLLVGYFDASLLEGLCALGSVGICILCARSHLPLIIAIAAGTFSMFLASQLLT